MREAPVVVERLTKTFAGRRALSDVSFQVDAGQILGFLGPNGAGKSTTIRCLLGLYRPSSGRARVLGHDPAAGDASFLAGVGYLPGELRLPASLTGGEVLSRFAGIRRLRDTTYREELVERLGAELDRPVQTLSKGNKQKLGIILAFMHRPQLLVLDEPTSGLDPLLQDEFATLLRESAAAGRTVLLSSHDLDEVQRLVQRLVVIRGGCIVVDDTVERLRADAPRTVDLTFDHEVDTRLLATVPGVTITAATNGHVRLTHTGPAAPLLEVITPLAPDTITSRPADLEDLFIQLYAARDQGAPDAH